ncbi:MAG: hypothetical protein OCC49_08295 [Fibrobacterales bacterium]
MKYLCILILCIHSLYGYNPVHNPHYASSTAIESKKQIRTVLMWNSGKGNSTEFVYKNKKWNEISVTPPKNIVESSQEIGEVLFQHIQVKSKSGKKYTALYAWNSKTGKTERYFYHKKKWQQSKRTLPKESFDNLPKEAGTIMASFYEKLSPKRKIIKAMILWNTKTGESARFYEKKGRWIRSPYNLPEAPLQTAGATGEVMMDYHIVTAPSGSLYHVALIWNTQTGQSVRYYFKDKKWYKSDTTLPEQTMVTTTGSVGEIMMQYSELPKTKGLLSKGPVKSVLVWNTKTGVCSQFRYSGKVWVNSTITLPHTNLLENSGGAGDIMAHFGLNKNGRSKYSYIVMWNTKTGAIERYYSEGDGWLKSDVPFPEYADGEGPSFTYMYDYVEQYW